ncbi:hypothetical protein [Bradyrhizobium sp. CCGUVB14]|uniref:hypothetical protein n=1 Tax=Bradyrhizobium sp. CCGUVB14 TaxID=2949628 RepID=UPI0020B1D3A7|nr:hypothetical protein [Bradyrhizobium sp. CCGUVB14]MCP3447333.1 hypothetical protein [Bradyrhizobium sp. CCGUVB14]
MLFRPSTKTRFRNAAIGAGIITLAAVSAFPAAAEQKTTPIATSTDQVTVGTNCHDYKPGVLMADTKCEILKARALDAQGKALDAQGKALDAQGSTLAAQNACIAELVRFKKGDPDKFKSMGFGTITRDNACSLASRLPKQSASLQQ